MVPRFPTVRTLALLALVALVTTAGECRNQKSLGPQGPNVVRVHALVFSNTPRTAHFTQQMVFTVTAVDQSGRPVRNSQNGIVIDYCSDCADLEVSDFPDADNAVVQGTLRLSSRGHMDEWSLTAKYTNADGSVVTAGAKFQWLSGVAQIVPDPAGPYVLQVAEARPVQARFLDATGAEVPGVQRYAWAAVGPDDVLTGPTVDQDQTNGVYDSVLLGVSPGVGKIQWSVGDARTEVTVHVVKVPVAVLRTHPEGPFAMTPGERLTFRVSAFSATGNLVLAADGGSPTLCCMTTTFPSQISVASTTASIVEFISFANPVGLDGMLDVTIEGKTVGLGNIIVRHPDVPNLVIPVRVGNPPPPGNVYSVNSQGTIRVNETRDFEAGIDDPQGNAVPGDEFVTATSSDPAVATIEAKIDDVPKDGRVKFRVKGVSVGQTTITYRYPGGPDGADTTDTTILTVNP